MWPGDALAIREGIAGWSKRLRKVNWRVPVTA